MSVKGLKIGLDFHGVINDRPGYFARFTRAAIRKGYEIHVITGGPLELVRQTLEQWGVAYTEIFAILDYYDANGEVRYFENGEYKIPDKLWDTAKAEYCAVNGINVHVDDSSVYVKWFTTPYCHYDSSGSSCTAVNGTKIDFSASPLTALHQIEKMISTQQFY